MPWPKGKKRDVMTRRRIAKSMSGEKNPNYGKVLSEETKKKMSEAAKKRVQRQKAKKTNKKINTKKVSKKKRKAEALEGFEIATPAHWAWSVSDGDWQPYDHLLVINKKLMDIVGGRINRLMVSVPPQHGKSELISRYFPAWYLGVHPNKRVILTSYEADWASTWGRKARNLLEEHGERYFGVDVSLDSSAAHRWDLEGYEGGMMAASVRGPVTGKGAHIAIIDDPIKDSGEALSEAYRRSIWDWYLSTLSTRIREGGAIILIMCMPGNTRVMMEDGTWRHLDTIRPDEKVMTWDEGVLKPKKVEAVVAQGSSRVYSIKTGNHSVDATGNHPFLVYNDGEYEWVRADKLKVGDKIVVLGCWSGGENKKGLTNEDCWALGYMFGDGWVTRHPNSVGAMRWATCVAKGEYDELNDRICEYFESRFGRKPVYKKKAGYYRTEVAQAGRWFESLGLNGAAKTKRLPDFVFGLPLEHRLGFIEGFVAADGSVDKYDRVNIRIANKELLEDIKLLCESCGYRTSNITSQTRMYQSPNSPQPIEATNYHISFSIVNLDEQNFSLKAVTDVKVNNPQPVYDLTVKDTHNFIAEGCVVHNTRWHTDDLAGRLLRMQEEVGGDQWEVVNLPALAEEGGDVLGRKPGEALCPELFTVETLNQKRMTMGSYWWNAMYQGRPSPPEGAIVKRDWLKFYDREFDKRHFNRIIQSWDLAFKDTKSGSFVVGQVWGAVGSERYLLDQVKARMDFPATVEAVRRFTEKWPEAKAKLVEDKANGPAVISVLGKEISGMIPVTVKDSKIARLHSVSPQFEAGNVYLPSNVAWIDEYVDELISFPNAAHDDQVDTTTQALWYLEGKTGKESDLLRSVGTSYASEIVW